MLSKANQAIVIAHKQGYRVDDAGQVWSSKGKPMAPCFQITAGHGLRWTLMVGVAKGVRAGVNISRLAGYQWFGPKIFEPGMRVSPIDGDPTNLRRSNWQVGRTYAEHIIAALVTGRRRLTGLQVDRIRRLHTTGRSYASLAQQFDVSKSCIRDVVLGITYQRVFTPR